MKKTFLRKCTQLHLCLTGWVMLMLLAAPASLRANPNQDKNVTGVVTSAANGEALIGVSVQVKETGNGTITDLDGRYSIKAAQGQTLVFSYVGFKTQEIKVGPQATLNVNLSEDSELLDEVVVVGYGVQKKKLVTGATVQVKGDDIASLNTTSPLQAMQGLTPGVSITSTSGQPGADMKVTVRGLGTTGDASPLYLIDGIGGDITTLNPADIESIDVLKDAASAAIYGAQAANGVILITTKSGKEGKSQISFDAYYGIQNVARWPKLLNAEEYKMIQDEVAVNSGGSVYDWASMASIWNADGTPVDTDWLDAIEVENAKVQSYSLGITGGSATSTYAMSLGYMYQEGLIGGSGVNDMHRYNFRINSEHKLYKDVVKVGERVSVIFKKKYGINDFDDGSENAMYTYSAVRAALATSPISPIYGENKYDTEYFSSEYSDWNTGDGNPYGLLMTGKDLSKNWTIDANAYVEINPLKNFTFKSVFGISYGSSEGRTYYPQYSFDSYTDNQYNYVGQSSSNGLTITWTNTASYSLDLGEHNLSFLVGMESSRYDGTWTYASNQDLGDFDSWSTAYLSNAIETRNKATGAASDPTRTVSYFARVGWNLRETYMANATLRADGSSKFAKGHRWGYFPSVSVGWVATNESFLAEKTEGWLDFLKIRASWGQVGNQSIDAFQYLATIESDSGYYNSGSTTTNQGTYPGRTANEDLTWETSEQFNIGIDSRFLNNRLGFNFDFYIKKTKDWLVDSPTYATSGFETMLINGGDVKNTGFEVALSWNDKLGKDFRYNIAANVAYNKNEVGSIPTDDGIIHGSGQILSDDTSEIFRAENGHAMGYYWGYVTDGLFQNNDEIAEWIAAGNGVLQSDVAPGDVRYVDMNHDGVIDDDDKTDLGNGMPRFTFGINLGFQYKNFDFSMVWSGAADYQIMQSYRNYTSQKANYTSAILDRWTGEGTSTSTPRMSLKSSGNYEFSDLFLHHGDFIRLSNVTIGYDFAKLINLKVISQARLYVQAQNLLTLTNYDGMDPEVGFGYNSWVYGMDLGTYPRARTFLVGVNLKF